MKFVFDKTLHHMKKLVTFTLFGLLYSSVSFAQIDTLSNLPI
jgi:hypothetical protein